MANFYCRLLYLLFRTRNLWQHILNISKKMTIIKNHFEIFLVTSKKQENGIMESKVGLYLIKDSLHIFVS
jgi:CRISPR/Cas system CMR-associated protein Cmr3 (group 5 of RAMP superfamily)